MINILFKATVIWLIIVVVAILNGIFREGVLIPLIGTNLSLPLSGILLAILVFLITLKSISYIGSTKQKTYIWIGFLWVVFTLFFEFSFGHFFAGKSWQEIVQIFNVREGDLFSIVLFITAVSPWVCAKQRGIL